MKTDFKYFGTSLSEKGHYLWNVYTTSIYDRGIDFRGIPFDPQDFPKNKYEKGNVEFHIVDGYSIFAIAGSPIDNRGGTKTVFFINKEMSAQEMYTKMIGIPSIVEILDAFPFPIFLERVIGAKTLEKLKCNHPIDFRTDYLINSILCKQCGEVIEQNGMPTRNEGFYFKYPED